MDMTSFSARVKNNHNNHNDQESDSQVTCHRIRCILLCGMDRHVIQESTTSPAVWTD